MAEKQFLFDKRILINSVTHAHYTHDLIYTAYDLNLLYVFLEKHISLLYFIAHTGRASGLPLLAYRLQEA